MKSMKYISFFLTLFFILSSCSNGRNDDQLLDEGNQLLEQQNYSEALNKFTKAVRKNKNKAEAFALRGYCFYLLENYPDAMSDYSKSLEINPNNQTALFGNAVIEWNLEKYSKSFSNINKVIEINPLHEKAFYYRGRAFLYHGDTLLGLNDLNRAIEIDSCYLDAYYLLSSIMTTQKKFEKADEYLGYALKCVQEKK